MRAEMFYGFTCDNDIYTDRRTNEEIIYVFIHSFYFKFKKSTL